MNRVTLITVSALFALAMLFTGGAASAASVSGTVKNQGNLGLPNVSVEWRNATDGTTTTVTTATNGTYSVTLDPATYTVKLTEPASNTVSTVPNVVVAGSTTRDFVLILAQRLPPVTLSGTVLREDTGGPAGNVRIFLYNRTYGGWESYNQIYTDANGDWSYEYQPALGRIYGKLLFRAHTSTMTDRGTFPAGWLDVRDYVDITGDHTEDFMVRSVTTTGKITRCNPDGSDSGLPVEGVTVRAYWGVTFGHWGYSAVSAVDGTYSTTVLQGNLHRAPNTSSHRTQEYVDGWCVPYEDTPLTTPPGQSATIDAYGLYDFQDVVHNKCLPVVPVMRTKTVDVDGNPIGHVEVQVYNATTGKTVTGGGRRYTERDPNDTAKYGSACFGVSEGELIVTFNSRWRHGGNDSAGTYFGGSWGTTPAGRWVVNGFTMPSTGLDLGDQAIPTLWLRGQTVPAVPNVRITAYQRWSTNYGYQYANTDADGKYELAILPSEVSGRTDYLSRWILQKNPPFGTDCAGTPCVPDNENLTLFDTSGYPHGATSAKTTIEWAKGAPVTGTMLDWAASPLTKTYMRFDRYDPVTFYWWYQYRYSNHANTLTSGNTQYDYDLDATDNSHLFYVAPLEYRNVYVWMPAHSSYPAPYTDAPYVPYRRYRHWLANYLLPASGATLNFDARDYAHEIHIQVITSLGLGVPGTQVGFDSNYQKGTTFNNTGEVDMYPYGGDADSAINPALQFPHFNSQVSVTPPDSTGLVSFVISETTTSAKTLTYIYPVTNTNVPIILGVDLVARTTESLTSQFVADQLVDGLYCCGVTAADLNLCVSTATFSETHTMELTGLTPSTTYSCQVCGTNSFGEQGCSEIYEGTTLDVCDDVAPTQSNFAYNTSDTKINVTWSTNEACLGTVVVNGDEQNPFGEDALGTTHGVVLSGLIPETEYVLSVSCTDTCGNTRTQTSAITTLETQTDPDLTAPVCSGEIADLGDGYVVFAITCNEPSRINVQCSDTVTNELLFGQVSSYALTQSVTVTSLTPGATYQCGGIGFDPFDNQAAFPLPDVTTPETVLPMIIVAGPSATTSDVSASINWETGDAAGDSRAGSTEVRYGIRTGATCSDPSTWPTGNLVRTLALTVNHTADLNGLQPSTVYCYVARSVGVTDEVESAILEFTTLATPISLAIEGVAVTTQPSLGCEEAVVSVNLSKPGEVVLQVSAELRPDGGLLNPLTAFAQPAAVNHGITIDGLTPGVTHYYSVLAYDQDGNEVRQPVSGLDTFENCGGAPNAAPVVTSTGGTYNLQCTSHDGAEVPLTGTVNDPYACTLSGCPGDEVLDCVWTDTTDGSVLATDASEGATAGPPTDNQTCSAPTTFGVGTHFVRLTATETGTDGLSGQSGTFQVLVRDTTGPCVNAGPDVAWDAIATDCDLSDGSPGVLVNVLDSNGDGTEDVGARPYAETGVCGDAGLADLCDAAPSLSVFPPAYDVDVEGPNVHCVGYGQTLTVTLTATDSAGNSGADSFTVSVADLCDGVDCSGLDDECVVGQCNPASGACGTTPRPELTTCDDTDGCTVSDVCRSGVCLGVPKCDYLNSEATCRIGVCDATTSECTPQRNPDLSCNHAPDARCVGLSVLLDGSGMASITAAAVADTSIDPDGDAMTFSVDPSTFTCTDIGSVTVIATVSDYDLSDTCSATVTVADETAPTLTCAADVNVPTAASTCAATVTYADPTLADNCGGASYALDSGLGSGASFGEGTHTETFSATDSAGNTASCSVGVTVSDTEPPAVTCPVDVVADNDGGVCGAVVTFATPTGTDNCAVAGTVQSSGGASGDTFAVGATNQAYTTTDSAGLTATCNFSVTIDDAEPPTISCPANQALVNDTDACGAVATFADPISSDNCASLDVQQTEGSASGSLFGLGTTAQTFTAIDGAGNAMSCGFNIDVSDTQDPTITCPADITVGDGGGCTAVVNYASPAAGDNCPGATAALTSGLGSGSTFPIGDTVETWTATDATGRTASCSFTVTVLNTDGDGDTVPCLDDSDDTDPTVCRDVDADTCDDCTSGTDDVSNDGPDLDGDGICNATDNCIADPNKTEPGICGCGYVDAGDDDGDGVLNCVDVCEGSDDAVDDNANGIPDGCDNVAIIVDSDNANNIVGETEYADIGEWSTINSPSAYKGTYSRSVAGSGADQATFSAFLPQDGQYEVYVGWVAQAQNATNAPWTVVEYNGTGTTFRVDQTVAPSGTVFDGQELQLLGTFQFRTGQASSVYMVDAANGRVAPDAVAFNFVGGLIPESDDPVLTVVRPLDPTTVEVKFNEPINPATDASGWSITAADGTTLTILSAVTNDDTVTLTTTAHAYFDHHDLTVTNVYDLFGNVLLTDTRTYLLSPPTVIVDNPTSTATGPKAVCEGTRWRSTTAGSGYYANNYQYGRNNQDQGSTCTYTPNVVAAGNYTVSALWVAALNRTQEAIYRINDADGSTTVLANQELPGDSWNELGVANMAAGSGTIVLQKPDDRERTVADAIRFKALVDLGGGGPVNVATSEDGLAVITNTSPLDMWIEPVATPEDGNIALGTALPAMTIVGTAYLVGPGGQYPAPHYASMTITYDDADLPAGTDESTLEIYTLNGTVWEPLVTLSRDIVLNTLTVEMTHQSLFAILAPASNAVAEAVVGTNATTTPEAPFDTYNPPETISVSFALPTPWDVSDIALPIDVDKTLSALSVSAANGIATVVFDGSALLALGEPNVSRRVHTLNGRIRAQAGDETPPAFDNVPFVVTFTVDVVSSLLKSKVHNHGHQPHATFRGDMILPFGEQAGDFRSSTEAAFGTLTVSLGGQVVYDNASIAYELSGTEETKKDEKWEFEGLLSKEKVKLRWDTSPEYDANNDPDLPSSLGKLESEFIGLDETMLKVDFKKATLPLTIVIDGIVLLSIDSSRDVTSAFPLWVHKSKATVAFPDGLVPGNTVAWYRDAVPGDGLSNFVYQHECAADGTASATYITGSAKYEISVPLPDGLDISTLERTGLLAFTLGDATTTLVHDTQVSIDYSVKNDNGDKDWKYRFHYDRDDKDKDHGDDDHGDDDDDDDDEAHDHAKCKSHD